MNIISKIKTVYVNEGFINLVKRSFKYFVSLIRINFFKNVLFFIKKRSLKNEFSKIFNEDAFDRIVVWRGSLGWHTKMFQRHQQIAKCLAKQRCLVLFEVTRYTEKVDFLEKICDNLYLIDYELKKFSLLLHSKINKMNIPKYLQIYSTAWDLKYSMVESYVSDGFKLVYEYIDDLNPILAGVNEVPEDILNIYDYVIKHREVLVVTSADRLYENVLKNRGSSYNVIKSSNGVDIEHFIRNDFEDIEVMNNIKKRFKTVVGYYGALASWFDYDLLKKLAKENPEVAFVSIGIKYDESYKMAKLDAYENIFYIEAVDYDMLPSYANYFDIAWIPFIINEITLATNPVKAFEYMALGKFIIASDMPECRKYKSINIAKSVEQYQYLLDNWTKLYTQNYIDLLKKEAFANSWDSKANDIIKLMEENEV